MRTQRYRFVFVLIAITALLAAIPASATSVINHLNQGCLRYIDGFNAYDEFPYRYNSCLYDGLHKSIIKEILAVKENYDLLKKGYNKLQRVRGDFYTVNPQDCTDEKRTRTHLEDSIKQADRLTRRIRAAQQLMDMVLQDTFEDLKLSHGMKPPMRLEIMQPLRNIQGVVKQEGGGYLKGLRVLKNDLRKTQINSRCARYDCEVVDLSSGENDLCEAYVKQQAPGEMFWRKLVVNKDKVNRGYQPPAGIVRAGLTMPCKDMLAEARNACRIHRARNR